ncbi:hypothetical protein P4S55_16440 [Shewanella sp. PP-Sp27a-2]
MAFLILGKTKDLRTNANVIYCKCSISEYLDIVGDDFENFSIQRKKESHKAYKRLKDDLKGGALLPSITLSVKHHRVQDIINSINNDEILINKLSEVGVVDILDGLQRTYLIKELADEGWEFPDRQEVLLEFWLEADMSRLIYRMIVLNAGQKAMSMRHQVELLFMSLKQTISEEIRDVDIYVEKNNKKRTASNKYPLGVVASAYQAFITRSTEVDKNDVVSNALIKDNVMDASEDEHTRKFKDFIEYFKLFKKIDEECWRLYSNSYNEERFNSLHQLNGVTTLRDGDLEEYEKLNAYRNAHAWLGNENVLVSFFCAISQYLNTEKKSRVDTALSRLETMVNDGVEDPLGLVKYEFYKSQINPKKSNVGHATRKLILNGFKEFFRDEGDTPFLLCWEQATD